jgi:DNA-binding transcriptional MerR regulator
MTVKCYNNTMDEKKYTIKELCELTGYSVRTIRYYIQEGLLEPPAGRGRGGFYFNSHLDQLNKIKALQEKGMKLNSMIEYFQKDQVQEPESSRNLWVKYEVSPGLEINVRRDLEQRERKRIFELIRIAKSIVREVQEDDA